MLGTHPNFIYSISSALKEDVHAGTRTEQSAQHYEVLPTFFALVLGPNCKYSSCFYKEPVSTLQEAEEEALRQTVEHADLADGQSILELGCGWGSLSPWMARQFPNSQVTAVSNSHSQRQYIEGEATARGLKDLRVITADMNVFDPARQFDRTVSVEMFEHMMNWRELLIERILRNVYGNDTALWMRRWRWFFLATAGLLGYAGGSEWGVGHYRMKAASY